MTSLGQAATVAPEALPSGHSSDSELAASALTAAGAFVAAHSAQLHTLRVHLTQEFRTLAGLRHPHIVSVLDYGFDRDHQPYFTMEYLERAEPLDKAAREQPFSVKVNLWRSFRRICARAPRRSPVPSDTWRPRCSSGERPARRRICSPSG
jgi:serine/threonine protein kinase